MQAGARPAREGGAGEARLVTERVQAATARLAHALNLDRREARLEAQILTARALGVNRAWLIAHDRDELPPLQAEAVEALIARREQGEPVAYILGEKEFYGRMFKVTPDVLIPRPETELLLEAALARLPQDRPARVLDLGTGSGCLAISIALERPLAAVIALDAHAATLRVAEENGQRLGAGNVGFLVSDWYARLSTTHFDMILSNPPYITAGDAHLGQGDLRHEPEHALVSGADGLGALRTIVLQAPAHLVTGGWLLLEHGYDQAEACRALMEQAGLGCAFTLNDLGGQTRVAGGQWLG